HLYKRRIIMIYDLAVTKIKLCDLRHIICTELEIPDVHVLLYTVFVHRLRNNDYISLGIPSQSDLCSALSIFLTDLCQHRVGKDAMTALCERSPRFRNNSVLLHKRKCILLLKERMKF